MPHNIFISYSRRDLVDVKQIKTELERCGLSCWMDLDGIESGAKDFRRKIAPALDDCQAVLFFISEDSQKSEWTAKELGYAQRHGKRIVPLRFNDDPLVGEYDLDYGNANIIDWRVPEQRDKLLRDLSMWSRQVEQAKESGCGPDSDVGMPRKPSGMFVSRRVVYGILALLALLGGAVCAGVIWYNERRTKNSVAGIRIESMVLKEKIGRISKENGFGQKIDAMSDELIKAEALYCSGRWHESAGAFTNYVQHCRDLVDLDSDRQSAGRAKEQAEIVRQHATSQSAMTYATTDWSLAVQTWENADVEFRRMEFAASRAFYEKSARQFEECAKVAKSEKKRLEQEEETKRRIAEQKRREAEALAAERRAEDERRKQEAQRQDAEKLTKLCASIKIRVRSAKSNMERIADFRADPAGFEEHLDNADEKWKYIDVLETNPATVAAAEAVLKLVEESENVIANELEWLKANKGARDEAKFVEAEIGRTINPEVERVEAGRYANETYLDGKRLRNDGNSALARGDFLVAKERLLAAKVKLQEAIAEAKSPWASDMWQHLKEDVLSVRLEYEKHIAGNLLVAYIPQRWLDLCDAHLTLDLMRGTNVVERMQNLTLSQGENVLAYSRVKLKCPARRTKGVDAYLLHISYQSWPIDLRFIPTVGVNIEDGKFDQKVTPLVMSAVSFMGERRELLEPVPRIQGDVIMVISNNLNRVVRSYGGKYLRALGPLGVLFEAYLTGDCINGNGVVWPLKFSPSLTEVQTNGLLHAQARAQGYSIAYTNAAPSKCRIVLSAVFLNPCGAQIFAVRDEKKLGAWEGGESILSMPRVLQGCELPSCVILKWIKD